MDRSPRVGVPGLHGWFSESEALLDGTPEALERFAQIILGGCDSIEVHLETTGDTALPNEGLLSAIIIRTRPLPVLVIFREGFQLIIEGPPHGLSIVGRAASAVADAVRISPNTAIRSHVHLDPSSNDFINVNSIAIVISGRKSA